jgi:hypothetical protein
MDFFEFAQVVRDHVATVVQGSQVEDRIDAIPLFRWIHKGKEAQINIVGAGFDADVVLHFWIPDVPRSQVSYQAAYMALSEANARRAADGIIHWLTSP